MSKRKAQTPCWFAIALIVALGFACANAQESAALSGRVTSAEEGAMEGVLVSAQQSGSPITVTVVTDQNGSYRFPAARLAPGSYALRIRATGYELDGAGAAEVAAGRTATADLRLRKAHDLAAQLTSTEWLISMPGTAEQKRPLIECMSCHTVERIVRSKLRAPELAAVLKRMQNYANNSTVQHPQKRVVERELADKLETINLSAGETWSYPLQTLPRPKGRATRVIITEYALPRPTIAPHDVRPDPQGFVWYSNFVEPYLGRIDARTGQHSEFRYALPKPDAPAGALALEPDQDGNWWLSMMFQSGLVRFDPRTQQFRHFPIPPDLMSDATQQSLVMP